MDRLERLLNLTMVLLETPRPLSAAELAEAVPGYGDIDNKTAFRRALERDKDALRDMGVPIAVEPVPGTDPPVDGYRVRREDYELHDPGLEADELTALALAASSVRFEGTTGSAGIWKLGGAPGPPDGAGTELVDVPGGAAVLAAYQAIDARATASFRYRGRERVVDPQRLDFQQGHWYLTAHDRGAGERRVFRLDRVDGEVVLGEPDSAEGSADAPPPATARPWLLGEEALAVARVLVDADHARWAVQQVGDDGVAERHPDGSVTVELEVRNRDGFRSFVLGFLDHAEVLSPDALRDDLVRWLQEVS